MNSRACSGPFQLVKDRGVRHQQSESGGTVDKLDNFLQSLDSSKYSRGDSLYTSMLLIFESLDATCTERVH